MSGFFNVLLLDLPARIATLTLQLGAGMHFSVGDRLIFLGYQHLLLDMAPILNAGDAIVVAAVIDDFKLHCFPIDNWGRMTSLEGETVI